MYRAVSFRKLALILCLTIPFSLLVPYIGLNLYGKITMGGVPIKPIPVTGQYRDAFDATVAVHAAPIYDPIFKMLRSGSGTGIILETGYIITNKHVVDSDGNGTISSHERHPTIKLSSTSEIHSGTVIYASEGHWRGAESLDFAIIAVPNLPRTNIHLMSNKDYNKFYAGRPVFAIGRSLGMDPPHFTKGIRSTDVRDKYHRASIGIFYGNSGGGLFSEETGELLGICTRIIFHNGIQAPDWAEYVPPGVIRDELNLVGLGYIADKREKPFNWAVHVYSVLAGLVFIYGIKKYKAS